MSLPATIRDRLIALIGLHGLTVTRCSEQMGRGPRWLPRKLIPLDGEAVRLTMQDVDEVLAHLGESAGRLFSSEPIHDPRGLERLRRIANATKPLGERGFVRIYGKGALRLLVEQGLVAKGDPLTLTPAGLALVESHSPSTPGAAHGQT